jgi:hypothetical protein
VKEYWYCQFRYRTVYENITLMQVADPDPVLFYPQDPGSVSGTNFFRISDPGSFFCYDLDEHFAPESIRSNKK